LLSLDPPTAKATVLLFVAGDCRPHSEQSESEQSDDELPDELSDEGGDGDEELSEEEERSGEARNRCVKVA